MLRELKFVQGAVARKDFVPAMKHFRIEDGTVRSFNGSLALCSPIPFDIDCSPKADTLVKAISLCKETVTLSMTPANKLRIQSGKFRAFIDTIDDPAAHVIPEGKIVEVDGEVLLQAFKIVSPFIGDDASRPWTNGVLLLEQSAFATNNVCLIEYWLGIQLPFTVNIPREAVREILRIDEAPTHLQITENSVTFHFTDNRWIRTQLLELNWPDLRGKVLDFKCNAQPVDPRLFEGINVLQNFTDDSGRIYIQDGIMRTHEEGEIGASYDVEELKVSGLYQIKMLNLLKAVATSADFTRYPAATLFFGERLRGAIIGMHR
jgi:hypothetical protein